MNYIIYSFDARELMKYAGKKKLLIDLNTEYDRARVLIGNNKYPECALFDQIIRVAKSSGDTRSERDILAKNLVYFDFKRNISDVEAETRELLNEGVQIRFPGDKAYTRFCSFDKSASMSRDCRISFISEILFDDVNEALDMGLDKSKVKLFPSKYYAYRGLYMTSGTPVLSPKFVLNENTVVVLGNGKLPLEDKLAITVPAKINCNGKVEVNDTNKQDVNLIKTTPHDGEGLISPRYTEIISREIKYPGKTTPTSFQIRMPFSKGMLHDVNFHKFFQDEFPDEDFDSLEITDFFGIKRRLKDVEVILTDSMFKCAEWLKEQLGIYERNAQTGKKERVSYKCDPMKFYFENFDKHEHKLYIAKTDANLRGNELVKMNYQFLSTLDISKDQFERMISKHIDYAEAMLKDPVRCREIILSIDDETVIDDIDSEHIKQMESWEYALLSNLRFAKDPMIRKRLIQTAKSQIQDIIKGRLLVEGCGKYLSGDLLRFLITMAKNCGVKDEKHIKILEDMCLLPDRFYMSGFAVAGMSQDNYYGVLRSPHLSRNEQCALRPYSAKIYKDYFGKLKGIVMVSDFSDAPAAMSGADFDGDIVKIILNEDINSAILETVYEKEIEKGPDSHGVFSYKRIIPVPLINAPKGDKEYIGNHISYKNLSAAFSSRVGHISNLAVRIAKLEYGNDSKSIPDNSTALCTIATGLEIDSVKNGAAPDIRALEELCGKDEDVYLGIKSKFDRIQQRLTERAVHIIYDEIEDKYTASFEWEDEDKASEELFSITGKQRCNIDFLPYYYAKALYEKRATGRFRAKFDKSVPKHCFIFELFDDWRDNAIKDSRIEQLKDIIGAYRKLNADVRNIERAEARASEGYLRNKIVTLLDAEYDTNIDKLKRSDEYIDEALEMAYQEMYYIVKDDETADAILDLMSDLNWQYITYDESRDNMFKSRVEILGEMIGRSDLPTAVLEIICDTYDDGYQILNYIVRDVKEMRALGELKKFADSDDEDVPKMIISPWKRQYNRELFAEIFSVYKSYKSMKEHSVIEWRDDVDSICREKVLALFDGNVDTAIECTLALDKTIKVNDEEKLKSFDEKHMFLWNVFEAQDLYGVISDPRKKGLINA